MYKSGLAIWYNVANLDRTLDLYTKGLGFEVDYQDPGSRMVIVKTNTKDCFIGFTEANEVVPVTSSAVFEVEDIDLAVAELKSRGVSFTGEIETIPDFVRLAVFHDPDGHRFELSQTLASS